MASGPDALTNDLMQTPPVRRNKSMEGLQVCVVGSLLTSTAVLKRRVEAAGGKLLPNVTNAVNLVVSYWAYLYGNAQTEPSQKAKQALALGVPCVHEDYLRDCIWVDRRLDTRDYLLEVSADRSAVLHRGDRGLIADWQERNKVWAMKSTLGYLV